MEPITRQELFMASAGGQSVDLPEPVTREEVFLKAISDEVHSAGRLPGTTVEDAGKTLVVGPDGKFGLSDVTVEEAVSDWLDDHPEATTTVEDGSITNAKLASSFVTPGTAAAYSSSATYAVGDYAFYNGSLYRCTTAITIAEAWTAAHWTAVTLGGDVTDLNGNLSDVLSNLVIKNNFSVIKKLGISSTGAVSQQNTYAITTRFKSSCIINNTPEEDANNVELQLKVSEWGANGTFIGSTSIRGKNIFYPSEGSATMLLCFGRTSGTGVIISDDDISTYLDVRTIENQEAITVDGKIDFSQCQYSTGGISSTYIFSNSAATSYMIRVADLLKAKLQSGTLQLRIVANSESTCIVGFVKTENLVNSTKYGGITVQPNDDITVIVPEDTKTIIVSRTTTNGFVKTPSNMIVSVKEDAVTGNNTRLVEIANYGLAFSDDYTDLSGYDANRISANGYNPASSFSNKVTIDKYIVCDTVSYKALVHFDNTTNVSLTLGTVHAGYTSSKHSTVVKFDFANSKVDFMTGSSDADGANIDGETLPEYVYDTFALTNIDGYMYTVEIGRINRCPYARVWNRKTGMLCGEKILDIYSTSASYGGKAGALYDFPTFAALTENVYFERIMLSVPGDVFAAFVGDSITEGSQVPVDNVWANMAGAYFGKSVNFGRGGGNITNVQKCVDDILSVIKPKYVIVTIGTNDGNTLEKLNTLIAAIKAIGSVPVINCITRASTSVEDVNNTILQTNTAHCRFDIATSVNNDLSQGQNESLFTSDRTHPNVSGHLAMYNEFMSYFNGLSLT